MLYIIERILSAAEITQVCQQITSHDDLVCVADGVYNAKQLATHLNQVAVLEEHLAQRGLSAHDSISLRSMQDLVALTSKHTTSITL